MSDSFFSRWSRRKQEAAAQATAIEPVRSPVVTAEPSPLLAPAAGTVPDAVPENPPLPTLDDVRELTPESDFQPFMQNGVGPEVRNAAMKKLFADPHFNVMDGLDIYIDDYSQPDPMPVDMLAKMASAQFLKLVPETSEESGRHPQDPVASAEPGQDTQTVAQSPLIPVTTDTLQDDHPDLQLQPDLAPADPPSGQRAG